MVGLKSLAEVNFVIPKIKERIEKKPRIKIKVQPGQKEIQKKMEPLE